MKCETCGGEMTSTLEDHLFTEIEVPNVVLQNIEVRRCANGHAETVIPRMAALHRELALVMARQTTRLTGAEFRFLRKHMGYASADFAKVLGVVPETVSRWEKGHLELPRAAEVAAREMVKSGQKAADYQLPVNSAPERIVMRRMENGWRPSLQLA